MKELKQLKVIVHDLDALIKSNPELKRRLEQIEAGLPQEVELAVEPTLWTDEPIWSEEEESNYRMRHAS